MRVRLSCVFYEEGGAKQHVEIFEKKGFGGCKRQIFVIGSRNAVRKDCIVEARRRSVRHGDDFD